MSNILLIREEYETAALWYERALAAEPEGDAALVGLARCNRALENYGTVRKLYERLEDADPALAERFAHLVGPGDEVGRPNLAGSLELGYDTSVLIASVTSPLPSPTNGTVSNLQSGDNVTFTLDVAPTPPTLSGTSPTSSLRPTWSGTSGGGGNGSYRYRLDNKDLTSGVFQYKVGSGNWSETSNTSWTLDPAVAGVWSTSYDAPVLSEGVYRLSVQERDAVGNWGTYGTHDIEVDFLPTGTLTIRDDTDNSSTSTDFWQVKLDSSGVANATEMRFKHSTDSTFSDWQTFATSTTWTLSGGDGLRTVNAEYRDAQGNDHTKSDSITCNPAWEHVGYRSLMSWPIGSSVLTSYLTAGQGFVVRFKSDLFIINEHYSKVVVNLRAGEVINVRATTYATGMPIPVETNVAIDVNWDCNPRLYIDLNNGPTSTTQQSGSDISI